MTCYLHIGMHKTGTTSIQHFLFTNRELLKKQDFLYPASIKDNLGDMNTSHNPFAGIIGDCFKKNDKISLDKFLEQFKKELDSEQAKNVIISSENILFLDTQEKLNYLKEILHQLGFKKVIIIVYIRDVADKYLSIFSQELKNTFQFLASDSALKQEKLANLLSPPKVNSKDSDYLDSVFFNYKNILQNCIAIFGKENLIVRLFDKSEFMQGDLIRDFLGTINVDWDEGFYITPNQNETLDLLGIEIVKALCKHDFPPLSTDVIESSFKDLYGHIHKSLTSKDPNLKFAPPKEILESYINFYAESNEWVRANFFPHKKELFKPKDLSNYKENSQLREMKPEYWERIARLIADILTDLINTRNALSENKIANIIEVDSALARVQDELAYKLGYALIQNSKSLFGFLRLPFVLSYIKDAHIAKQQILDSEIAQNRAKELSPLSSYKDYEQALKLQRSFIYNLGDALIIYDKSNKPKLSFVKFLRRILRNIRLNNGVHKSLKNLKNEQKAL